MFQSTTSLLIPEIYSRGEWNIRFGSKALCPAKRHVRFTVKSGHLRCTSACPLWANSGHYYAPFRIWARLHLSRRVATAPVLFLNFARSSVDRTTVRALFHLLASAWLLPQCAETGNTGASATDPPRECGRWT